MQMPTPPPTISDFSPLRVAFQDRDVNFFAAPLVEMFMRKVWRGKVGGCVWGNLSHPGLHLMHHSVHDQGVWLSRVPINSSSILIKAALKSL